MRYFLLAFLCFWTAALSAKTVYIVNIGGIDSSKYFYDYNFYRDEVSKPFVLLREAIEKAGFTVKFTSDCSRMIDVAAVISINDTDRKLISNLMRHPKEKCFLLISEPPVVLPQPHDRKMIEYFGKIFTHFDDFIDNQHYFKYYFPQPRLKMIDNLPNFWEKKLCTLINCNKDFKHPKALYGERRKVISFFTETGEFDLYGIDWGGYPAWKGPVQAKWDVLKNYKFCFCYENMCEQRGYITEKIFDALVAGCVPIYWGATNIADYIPKECFVDRRDFASENDLYQFIKNIDRETHASYVEAIRNFLASSQAQLFSSEKFVEIIMDSILSVNPENRRNQ